MHEQYAARPAELRRFTLRQLHSVYTFDASHKDCPWVARRAPAILTVSPRLSQKPAAGGPEYEAFCHQFLQLNTAYGEACDLKTLEGVLLGPVEAGGAVETWAAAFKRLHPSEYERLCATEKEMGARFTDDDGEDDGYGPDLEDDGGADGDAWWRAVGAGGADDVRRVVEGACPAAVLREYEEERKAFVRPVLAAAAVPYESLHLKQRVSVDRIVNAVMQGTPLRALICGIAGTGKSAVVKAVAARIAAMVAALPPGTPRPTRTELLIIGPTGCAASNVDGVTIHSSLGLFGDGGDGDDVLSAKQVATFKAMYKNVGVVIIDEVGMVGTRLMGRIAAALRQIFGVSEVAPLLGAVSVVAFGDFGQLPPVKDDPVWAGTSWKSSDGASGKAATKLKAAKVAGAAAWTELCSTHVKLTYIWRQAPAEAQLRGILLRQRNGESTQADVDTLNTRHYSRVPALSAEQKKAFTLAQTKADVAESNQESMTARDTPIFISRAQDDGNTSGLDSDVFRGLVRNVFLQKHARYLLTANLWVDGRLFNGRDCLLEYVVYASEEDKEAGHPVRRTCGVGWGEGLAPLHPPPPPPPPQICTPPPPPPPPLPAPGLCRHVL